MKNNALNLLVFLSVAVSPSAMAFPKAKVNCTLQNAAPGTGSLVFDSSKAIMCYENVPGNCTTSLPVVRTLSGSIDTSSGSLVFDEFFAIGRLDNGEIRTQWLRIYRQTLVAPTVGFATAHGADLMGDLFPGGAHFYQIRPMNSLEAGDPFCIVTPSN